MLEQPVQKAIWMYQNLKPFHSFPLLEIDLKMHSRRRYVKEYSWVTSTKIGIPRSSHYCKMGLEVRSPAQHSGLRIWCCSSCSWDHDCSSDVIPGPGTPYAVGRPKKNFWYTRYRYTIMKYPYNKILSNCDHEQTLWVWPQNNLYQVKKVGCRTLCTRHWH